MLKGDPAGISSSSSPTWTEGGTVESLLLKASRFWTILPMFGVPGVGQKPSPLHKTDFSDSKS